MQERISNNEEAADPTPRIPYDPRDVDPLQIRDTLARMQDEPPEEVDPDLAEYLTRHPESIVFVAGQEGEERVVVYPLPYGEEEGDFSPAELAALDRKAQELAARLDAEALVTGENTELEPDSFDS